MNLSLSNAGFGPEWIVRNTAPDAYGEIITFYSYKGGTGRSMALINCAGLIAQNWPASAKPLLLIDFDLEAPGLHHYLGPCLPAGEAGKKRGVLDLFEDLSNRVQESLLKQDRETQARLDDQQCVRLVNEIDLTQYVIQTSLNATGVIRAARDDDDHYAQRLSRMDWEKLYKSAPGLFRALASKFSREYAFTFIDARTGLSDTSGICTMLLPDVLTVVFTPNRQSLAGIEQLTAKALEYRSSSSDTRSLRIYPLPSRVEQLSESFRKVWQLGAIGHQVFGDVTGIGGGGEGLHGEDAGGFVVAVAVAGGTAPARDDDMRFGGADDADDLFQHGGAVPLAESFGDGFRVPVIDGAGEHDVGAVVLGGTQKFIGLPFAN